MLWKKAALLKERDDRDGNPNIKSIKRFVVPAKFDLGENRRDDGWVKFTVKETVEFGHRIYSLELEQIETPPGQGSTLFSDTTPEAFPAEAEAPVKDSVPQSGEKVKRESEKNIPEAAKLARAVLKQQNKKRLWTKETLGRTTRRGKSWRRI